MISIEVIKLVEKSGDVEACERILHFTQGLLQETSINMSDTQWLSLVSHLSAMVFRSVHKEPIIPIDKEMFNEVSAESIELAAKVCSMLPDLHEDEKYLLSIHFESSKMNA